MISRHSKSNLEKFCYISTMGKKKKTDYLSYIEETKKHYGKLEKLASDATKKAIQDAKAKDLYITYQEGKKVVREYSDGRKEVIGEVEEPLLKVDLGSEHFLSER